MTFIWIALIGLALLTLVNWIGRVQQYDYLKHHFNLELEKIQTRTNDLLSEQQKQNKKFLTFIDSFNQEDRAFELMEEFDKYSDSHGGVEFNYETGMIDVKPHPGSPNQWLVGYTLFDMQEKITKLKAGKFDKCLKSKRGKCK